MSLFLHFAIWFLIISCTVILLIHFACIVYPVFFWNAIERLRRRFRCLERDPRFREVVHDFIAIYQPAPPSPNNSDSSVVITVQPNPEN
ncbi:hypothetical protein GCK72_019319 [Caenorhabditis remanei]|uniref:Uncharacterized protein n=1 Tax=Caenorhabditis remanei TaxID=31234 RepID=A0A6A5GDF7_CAERE|nr:hypothetical protein GCK72_019319 [Caenorhabditis remanei]KAF1752764.1 hypothetical protein GCK72_019319 [Caenorhabditis remanei]